MNVTIAELMTGEVMTVTKHETAGHAATLMRRHKVSALPVVGADGEPVGIVTAGDLLEGHPESTPISSFMSKPVYAVGMNEGPHVAARVMRNHHLHHVVVEDQRRVVGIISAFDLLKLVEDHRYQAKQPPTAPRRPSGRQ